MNTVSVISPTYNEAENIVPLIEALKQHVSGLKEILIVDDDSPDGTASHVREWVTKHKDHQTRLIVRPADHGLRKSIQEGISQARGDIIVWMDADFSMPPADINKLTAAVTRGADIAVGSRFVAGGKRKQHGDPHEHWYTILTSDIGNKIMPRLFNLKFHDYTSGFVAVRKSVALSIPLRGSYGEYFIDFIVRAFSRGYCVVEVPYVCIPRLRGVSKTANDFPTLLKRLFQYGTIILTLVWQTKIERKKIYANLTQVYIPNRAKKLIRLADTRTGIAYRQLTASDIEDAVRLHKELIPSAGARIGESYLCRLYTTLLENPLMHFVLGAYENNRLVGIIAATNDFKETERLLNKRLLSLVPTILFGLVRNQYSLDELLSHVKVGSHMKRISWTSPYIVSLAVDSRFQRRGIATRLIQHVREHWKTKSLMVNTQATNSAARNFYKKMGFTPVSTVADSIIFRCSSIIST